MIDGLVFPGEYVAYEVVERLFKTCKSFNYFFCKTKEEDVDARGGGNATTARSNKSSDCPAWCMMK